MNKYAIILAAGKGTRMQSSEDLPKVVFPILGYPMVKYIVDALKPIDLDKIITVVGYAGEITQAIVKEDSEVVWQHEQKGAGHAVLMTAPILENLEGETIICCGDTPLLTSKTLGDLLSFHEKNGNDLTVLTTFLDDPTGYGRIIKEEGRFIKIVEQKDTDATNKDVKEVNAGVYVFDNKELFKDLRLITPNNAAHEYYLTDVIELFAKAGKKVETFPLTDIVETMGVNDREQLALAESYMQERINSSWIKKGAHLINPSSIRISPEAILGQNVTIKEGCQVLGKANIGDNVVIGEHSLINGVGVASNSVISANSKLEK